LYLTDEEISAMAAAGADRLGAFAGVSIRARLWLFSAKRGKHLAGSGRL